MKNDISVIITTKDRVDYLIRAYESIISQSHSVKEIIIVDDYSITPLDERVIELLDSKASKLNIKLVYHYNESLKGGNFSRNLGVRLSKSNVLMFLDDDDLWTNDKVIAQIKLFNDGYRFVYTGKQFVSSVNLTKVVRKSKERDTNHNIWTGNYIGSTSGVAMTRELFELSGGFDDKLKSLQDFDLWVRCLKICDAKWDNQYNLVYTVHKGTNSQISSNAYKHINSMHTIFDKYAAEIELLSRYDRRVFNSRMYHVVARAYRRNYDLRFFYYYFKSLFLRPSIRTLILIFKY